MYSRFCYMLMIFVICVCVLLVSQSMAFNSNPVFDGFQNAECFPPFFDPVYFHLKIVGGEPNQYVRVVWTLRPFDDRKQNSTNFHLNEYGAMDMTWVVSVFPPPAPGDCDYLMLIPLDPAGKISLQWGEWGSKKDAANSSSRDAVVKCGVGIPSSSEWGLIFLAFMILASTMILFYRCKFLCKKG